ncbi:MAG: hypothetical protein C4K49_05640 [Candidatus Thorarchaeota archaeon]|nr:MAG: hypothetical protein C4K49_05640 [Candidatus Thorarchaeota archaeon]
MRTDKAGVLMLAFFVVFSTSCFLPSGSVGTIAEDYRRHGPLIDKLVYKVISGYDDQALALMNNDIDLIGDMVDPDYLPELEEAGNVGFARTPRNGYGYLTIKCDKYPFNVTGFRRALAFALDKWEISRVIWENLSEPLDSCIPKRNPFSVEGQLPYSYYEGNLTLGNQMLNGAGFFDVDMDGTREAPNGMDFDVAIDLLTSSPIAVKVGSLVRDTLHALHVDATVYEDCLGDRYLSLIYHTDYDMMFLGTSLSSFDVDWLAYEFWSEYADEPYWNFPCFRNASYDSWREQLLHSADYDEVYEAAIEMQKIWVYECPEIVCYDSFLFSAYRNDRFEGFVNDFADGAHSWWTNYNVHLKESQGGPFGGALRWSNSLELDTFNFMASSSAYSWNILQELYDSLIIRGPDGEDVPWLAESYVAETHQDDPSVPEGHTRFTFSLHQIARWTDGQPLSADDVAFTMNYYRDAAGNPFGCDLTEMTAAYATSESQVVVEFGSESYWHLHTIGYKPIMPKHVFMEIGATGWDTWTPHPPTEPMVTSGPFNISGYGTGEFVELTRNPDYFHGSAVSPTIISYPSDITYTESRTGNRITWSLLAGDPVHYEITCNNTRVESGPLNDSSRWVSITVDGLSVSAYNYTLVVTDAFGARATDTVWVIVRSIEGESLAMLLATLITGAGVAVIVVFSALIIQARHPARIHSTLQQKPAIYPSHLHTVLTSRGD